MGVPISLKNMGLLGWTLAGAGGGVDVCFITPYLAPPRGGKRIWGWPRLVGGCMAPPYPGGGHKAITMGRAHGGKLWAPIL
jgi:hypothetical protein